MKFMCLCIIGLFLVSCSPETRKWQIKRAEEICAERDGIDYMYNALSGTYVQCENGVMIKVVMAKKQ